MSWKDCVARNFSLRLAKQTDARQLGLLLFELVGFSKRETVREIGKAITDKEIAVATTRNLRESSGSESLIGFVHGIVHNDPISTGPLLYVTSLYVKRSFRGQGVGSSLLDFIIHRSLRYWSIEGVEVATARKPALKFYHRLGFSQFKADFGEKLLQLDTETWKARRGPK